MAGVPMDAIGSVLTSGVKKVKGRHVRMRRWPLAISCQEMTSDCSNLSDATHHPVRMCIRGVIHTTIRWR